MELSEAIRRRRMVRRFADRPVEPELLDKVLDAGRRSPSAGFSQGTELLVLEGRAQTELFWQLTCDPAWLEGQHERARRGEASLVCAPVVVLPLANPHAYLERYRRPDKAATGLGAGLDAWPVPYWLVDAAFATMLMLLAATDAGLGALFFRIRRGEAELLSALGVPEGIRPIGALALGHPGSDPHPQRRPGRRPLEDIVHRGSFRAARSRGAPG
jgi:nitroreductase